MKFALRLIGVAGFCLFTDAHANDAHFGPGSMIDLSLQSAESSLRYRYEKDSEGEVSWNGIQNLIKFDFAIQFFDSKVSLDIGVANGRNFTGAWDPILDASRDRESTLFVRRLSLTARPNEAIELKVGSFDPVYGNGSQHSSLDEDGYIVGYRGSITLEQTGFVITGGFLGDLDRPNVIGRLHRLKELNYLQVQINQAIAEFLKASLEYQQFDGTPYGRLALVLDLTKLTHFMDSIAVEGLSQLRDPSGANVVTVQLRKRLQRFVAGQDMDISLIAVRKNPNFGRETQYPLYGRLEDGHSIRLRLRFPSIYQTRSGVRFNVGFDFQEAFSAIDVSRLDVLVGIRY